MGGNLGARLPQKPMLKLGKVKTEEYHDALEEPDLYAHQGEANPTYARDIYKVKARYQHLMEMLILRMSQLVI